jgi:plastocyanin
MPPLAKMPRSARPIDIMRRAIAKKSLSEVSIKNMKSLLPKYGVGDVIYVVEKDSVLIHKYIVIKVLLQQERMQYNYYARDCHRENGDRDEICFTNSSRSVYTDLKSALDCLNGNVDANGTKTIPCHDLDGDTFYYLDKENEIVEKYCDPGGREDFDDFYHMEEETNHNAKEEDPNTTFYKEREDAEIAQEIKKCKFKLDLIRGNVGDTVFFVASDYSGYIDHYVVKCTIVEVEDSVLHQTRIYNLKPNNGRYSKNFEVFGDSEYVFALENDAIISIKA